MFTGRGGTGRPTQLSRTLRGSKREAQRVAASLEAATPARDAGRTVADVLDAWQEVNAGVWAPASRRDYAGRIRFIAKDPVASIRLARLGVADVERWHARVRRAGVGETAIRGRHSALRAALSQAVRWRWIGMNPAMAARVRQPRHAPRQAMSTDDVQAVLAAAAGIDPAAVLALRLAASAGLRRAELATLRWEDLDSDRLTVDSSVARLGEAGASVLVDAPTKPANRRVVRLDADTVAAIEALRQERSVISPYLFSLDENPPPPSRIGWWWTRARAAAGIDKKWIGTQQVAGCSTAITAPAGALRTRSPARRPPSSERGSAGRIGRSAALPGRPARRRGRGRSRGSQLSGRCRA